MRTKIHFLLLFILPVLFFGQKKDSTCNKISKQKRLTSLEERYLDIKNDSLIRGRVNRNVNPTLTNTYVVEYDFRNGTYNRNKFAVQINTPVVFRILNINRLAYKIDVIQKDSILANSFYTNDLNEKQKNALNNLGVDTKATVLTRTKILEYSPLNEEDIKKNLPVVTDKNSDKKSPNRKISIYDITTIMNNIDFDKRKIEDFQVKQQELAIKIYDLNNFIKDTVNFGNLKSKEDSLISLQEEKRVVTNMLTILNDTILKNKAIVENFDKVFSNYNYMQERIDKSYNYCYNMYVDLLEIKSFYNTIRLASEDPYFTYEKFNKFKEKHNTDLILSKLKELEKSLKNFERSKDDFDIDFTALQNIRGLDKYFNDGGIIKLLSVSNKQKEIMETINKEYLKSDFNKIVFSIRQTLEMLSLKNNYEIISAPVQPLQDMIEFEVNVALKTESDKPHDSKSFNYRANVYGGVRFDIGLGLAGSLFTNAKLYDFEVKGNSTHIHVKSKQSYIPALIGLFTMSFRSTRYMTWGMSTGMGLDISGGKIQISNFYAGPSLVLGRFERITLTAGATIKSVDILKKWYKADMDYPTKDSTSDFLDKEFRVGMFIGFTYNLTRGMRDNVKYLQSFLK